jgi:hypothetical protein
VTGSVALVWPVMTAAFLASLVEAVEALTIVLAVAAAGVRERLLQWVSFSTELGRPRHVRFPPDSDRTADIASGPVRAFFGPRGHKTGNAKARDCRAIARQRWPRTYAFRGDDEPRQLAASGKFFAAAPRRLSGDRFRLRDLEGVRPQNRGSGACTRIRSGSGNSYRPF